MCRLKALQCEALLHYCTRHYDTKALRLYGTTARGTTASRRYGITALRHYCIRHGDTAALCH